MPKEFQEEHVEAARPKPEPVAISERGRRSIQGGPAAGEILPAEGPAREDPKPGVNDLKSPQAAPEDLKPELPAYKKLDKAELSAVVQAAVENPADGTLERDSSRLYRNMEAFMGPHPAGYDRHHLIPVNVARDHPAMEAAARLGYDINNPNNAVYLPENASLAARTGEPLHTRETRAYDQQVQGELDQIWTRYADRCSRAGGSQDVVEYLQSSSQQTAFLQDIYGAENSIRQRLVSRSLFITEADPNYKLPANFKKLDETKR